MLSFFPKVESQLVGFLTQTSEEIVSEDRTRSSARLEEDALQLMCKINLLENEVLLHYSYATGSREVELS